MAKDEYLTKTKLKDRGWSDRLIREFYSEPEKESMAFGRTYYLYSIKKIELIEQTEKFKAQYSKVEKRRKVMKKSVKKRKKKLVSNIKEKEINIDKIPFEQLRNLAIQSYNNRNFHSEKYASRDSDEEFLERIMVNYARHNLTTYDFIIDNISGKIGKQKAYLTLKKKVLKKIGRVYKSLSNETFRQRTLIPDL